MLRPATRNGPGLIVWGLLASARQQIAQGWQGSPGSQVVDDQGNEPMKTKAGVDIPPPPRWRGLGADH
jgi:hypothetical protein